MKVPISWLEEYVPVTLPLDDLAHRLTMAGTEVVSIDTTLSFEGVVVGLAKEVGPHPNADRLRLVQVDAGDETLEVVCGAPNVATGQKIAFARIGSVLTDAHTGEERKLKRSKIRGVTSNGMVCSERELGMSDEHEGILVLPEGAPIGMSLGEYLGETLLDLELTPNRPDCLAVMGVAREVAALTGETATPPSIEYPEHGPDIATLAKVEIEDLDLCRRYTATLIQGVKIGPSPDWLADRLRAIGERPINNVVDVTNYVMFELGQPLHAFDFDSLSEGRIVVRRARPGETLLTLDGETRELTDDNLMIADAGKPIGLGGIIGGTESGITGSTTSVLLEAANFDGPNNRRSASKFGIRTEATLRFEKNLRPELAEYGVRRATKLILEVAGGTVASGIIDEWPDKAGAVQVVELPANAIERLLGVSYESGVVISTFEGLGMEVVSNNGAYSVTPPYWRPDIGIPEDLIEELARVIGYEKIPTTGITGSVPVWEPNPDRVLREAMKNILSRFGMQETISYSLTTPEAEAHARPPGHGLQPLQVMNPLSAEHATLRTTLRHSILTVLSRNARIWRGPLWMFESGRVYLDRGEGVGLPDEPEKFVGVVAGPRSDLEWMSGEPESSDFYDAKGIVESLLSEFGVTASFVPVEENTFEPGRCAQIVIPSAGRAVIGVLGEVASDVLSTFDIDTAPVAMFELDVEAIARLPELQSLGQQDYVPFGRFPDSSRDLALVIDDNAPAADVLALAERNRLVVSATVFDVYQGDAIPSGKKSLAVRVVYQASDRTLTADELIKAENSILRALEHNFGAELRAR